MTVTELRALYKDNQLIEAIVEPSLQDGQWIIEFKYRKGGFVILTDDHGEECLYSDLDDASKSAMSVGFHQVRIEER